MAAEPMYTNGTSASFPLVRGTRCRLNHSYIIQWAPYVSDEPTMAIPNPRKSFEFLATFTDPLLACNRLMG